MSGLKRKFYSPVMFDILFAASGLLAVVGVIVDMGRAYPAIEAAADPLAKGGALLAAVLVSAVIAFFSTSIDEMLADDFVFQTLTRSAFVGMFIMFFTIIGWVLLLADKFGMMSSYAVIGVVVASWSIAWGYTRLRGTRAKA